MQSRLSGALSLLLAQALVLLLGWVTHPVVGRLLGPSLYGVYGVVLSLQTIIGLFLALGVPMAISRSVARDSEHAKSILWQALRLQIIIAVALSLATFGLSGVLASILGDAGLTNIIRFVAIVILFQSGYPIFAQYLSGMHMFNRQAMLMGLYAVVKLVSALLLILLWGVYGVFAGFASGSLVAAVVGWFWVKRLGGNKRLKLPLKAFLYFAGTYVLILVNLQLLVSLDLFMVKAMLGDNIIVGYYSSAVTLARIPFMLLQGLIFVLLPSVSALTKPGQPRERAGQFIGASLRYMIMLIVPAAALAAATSKNLVRLFYSAQYDAAAAPLTILIVGVSCLAFFQLLANIAAGAGKTKVALLGTMALLAISLVAGLILVPRLGLMGAAWQTTIAGAVGLVGLSWFTFKSFAIQVPVKSMVRVVVATAGAVLPTYVWQAQPLILPGQYVSLFGLYAVILFLLGEITVQDRNTLANLHPKLRWIGK